MEPMASITKVMKRISSQFPNFLEIQHLNRKDLGFLEGEEKPNKNFPGFNRDHS